MIMPSDKDYKETKQIILGRRTMKPEFKPIAEWIDETYNVRTINIFYDTIDKGTRSRLEICFEHPKEKEISKDKMDWDLIRKNKKQLLRNSGGN